MKTNHNCQCSKQIIVYKPLFLLCKNQFVLLCMIKLNAEHYQCYDTDEKYPWHVMKSFWGLFLLVRCSAKEKLWMKLVMLNVEVTLRDEYTISINDASKLPSWATSSLLTPISTEIYPFTYFFTTNNIPTIIINPIFKIGFPW